MSLRLSLIVALACAVVLAAVTLCIANGLAIPGDMALVQLAVQSRTPGLFLPMQVLSFIGSAIPGLVITLVVTLVEVWRRKRLDPRAGWALGAYLGYTACNIGLRLAVGRLRPQVDYIPNAFPELQASFQRYSFPSGHAGAALIAYTSLLVLAWPRRSWRGPALAGALLIVAGVGFGRVYLGVHWPTDVAAGYLLGGLWLCAGLGFRHGWPARRAGHNAQPI